jgi:succinate dehydrogenase / fumarate reductase, cytochrome b subunit
VHTIQGILLYIKNKAAKGSSYAVASHIGTSKVSRYMMHLGIIIFIFLAIHMYQFWWKMKIGDLPMLDYPGYDHKVKDLYALVKAAYSSLGMVVFYVVSMIFVGLHLYHGFQSAFQTLGVNHKKYTPLIRGLGIIYSILVPAAFALIPIVMYIRLSV